MCADVLHLWAFLGDFLKRSWETLLAATFLCHLSIFPDTQKPEFWKRHRSGYLAAALMRVPPSFRRAAAGSVAFGNSTGMPVVLLSTLAPSLIEQKVIAGDINYHTLV